MNGQVIARVPQPSEYHFFIPTSGITLGITWPRRITVERIKRAVATHYGLSLDHMTDPKREPRFSHPRQVAMYLARKLTPMSLPEIGRRFHRDHTTVIHAIRSVEQRMGEDNDTAKDVAALRAELIA